ncbi:MAG: helix-turn-helix domain-containing protein [Christensenellaceae bacterium]|jgi:transcriptional regulator with XRE-family HTH domain|nr:helix-turn-helix domain-containing protein [Christensenellaceae bacterium]
MENENLTAMAHECANNFSLILKDIMDERKLNQLTLSAILGISQSQIHHWLNGKSLPGYLSLELLIKKLNVKAEELFY